MGNPVTAWAQKRIDDAGAERKAVRKKLEEEAVENRKAYERFYNSLALFSSGTIALSVTYLGYLRGIPNKPVMYPKTLIASWLTLLVCLVASLFFSFFETHYMYFARTGEYLVKSARYTEVQLEEIDNIPFTNTPEELAMAKEDAKIIFEKAESAQKRKTAYFWLWVWIGRLARFAFPVGIGLLVFFAIKNM